MFFVGLILGLAVAGLASILYFRKAMYELAGLSYRAGLEDGRSGK